MEKHLMHSRERLQVVYELAFYPPRLHHFWNELKKQPEFNREEIADLLRAALSLHLALPEKGFQSQRALRKIANCQASAKAFGTESFIKNIGRRLGLNVVPTTDKIPSGMIRDMKLPEFSHGRRCGGAGSWKCEM